MGISAKAGVFSLNVGVGNQSIAGVGFRPEVVFFLPTDATGDGVTVDAHQGFGVGVSSSDRRAITANDEDAQGTTDSHSEHTDALCIVHNTPGTAIADYEADFVSADADGFTINITTAPGSAKRVGYLALGGTDLADVATGHFAGSNGLGDQSVTGIGFQPDAMVFFNIGDAVAPPDASVNFSFSLGFAVSSVRQAYMAGATDNNQAVSDTGRQQGTDGCIIVLAADGSTQGKAAFVSHDADGFTVNWSNASNRYIHYVALRGGQYDCGAMNSSTATGHFSNTSVAFRGEALFLGSFCNAAAAGKVDGLELSLGVATSFSDRFVAGCVSEDAQAASDSDSFQDDGLVYQNYDFAQAVQGAANFVSFNDDGFTLDQTDADPVANELIWFVIGPALRPVWTGGPTTPSLHQSLGLSIAYADPLVKSPRSAHLGELRAEINEYEHETAAVGGHLTARFDLAGDMVDVNDWFEHGIGRHVEVTSPGLMTRWEGFVNSVTVSAGQYGATRGPLVEIANRVGALYNERDTSVDPPVVIPGRETVIAQDADSQSVYGAWEKWVSAGETNTAGAEQARDSYLRENAHPTADDPRIVFEAGGQVSVSVECLGYWAWMQAYPYQDVTGSGTVTAQTKVRAILADDPNGVFSVDYSHVDYNAYLAPRYENSNTTAWEVMKALTAIGDANDNRWLFGVYAGRTAYYRQVPDEEKYQHRLSDPSQRLETVIGGEVAPWDVEPGEWIYLPDFLTGREPALTVADMRRDERYVFIESVRFRAPYSAEITGTRVGKLVQILAKKGMGGLGG